MISSSSPHPSFRLCLLSRLSTLFPLLSSPSFSLPPSPIILSATYPPLCQPEPWRFRALSCYPLLAIRYSLPAICTRYLYPLSVTRYPLSFTRYPLSVTRYPLSVTRYPLPTISYPLSVTRYPLPAIRNSIYSPFATRGRVG